MLIQSITATNFRKYQQLSIKDLPTQGVITVSGLNESGKSSIGEAICFALFGRTFNLTGTAVTKLIRWESDAASVSLTLSNQQGVSYTIERSIDSKGNSDASLTQAKGEKVIAKGTVDTDKAIHDLLGYTFNTFTDSFYLVARDLSNPDPDSNSIKQMAGIGEYSKISDELTEATTLNQQSIDELTPTVNKHHQALDTLNIDETLLPELVDAREVIALESEQKHELNGELAELSSTYKEQQKQFKRTRNGWRFFNTLTWILVPLMLVAWGIWLLFNFFPQQVAALSQNPEIAPHLEKVNDGVNQWGFQVTMGLVLLTSLILFFKWRSESKNDSQLADAEALSNTLKVSHEHSQHSLDGLVTARLRQTLRGKIQPQSALSSPPQNDNQRLLKLTAECKDFSADDTELDNTVQRLRDTLDQQQRELGQLSEPLEAQIDTEKDHSDKAGVIRSALRGVQTEIDDNQKQIDTQQTGVQLLQRASDALITDFNASITSRTEKTMPLFTDNRYKQIKISKDLSVHVYSDEKMDWIDFDEVSSGTQRQILLAVRIAMSEQLAGNTDNQKQFIFLDEPFTYFDQERTKSSLAALPKINDTTCQVWIVAQEFPEGSHYDKHIHCPETGNHILSA
ncbi:ATP-binding protein [Leucothrix pacifica]|uniref:Rad50/SbcC-type AAA domain-containing protein n=1 Tax=Leucothrix pacifica TaxID=1247513 RepID=A0A317CMQ7_9GAMM|nr:AAA family ATPase [Leucothrix pacifica]PWQ99794.1 hypothetical protein DKW60_04790 [Leucothrix pacifica]